MHTVPTSCTCSTLCIAYSTAGLQLQMQQDTHIQSMSIVAREPVVRLMLSVAGTLPALTNLRNISLFSASGNQLTGSVRNVLATSHARLHHLQHLLLLAASPSEHRVKALSQGTLSALASRAALHATLSSCSCCLPNRSPPILEAFALRHRSLPASFSQLSQLYYFNVSYNPGLCGGFTTVGSASSATRPLTVQLEACPGQPPFTAPQAAVAGPRRSSSASTAGAIAGAASLLECCVSWGGSRAICYSSQCP